MKEEINECITLISQLSTSREIYGAFEGTVSVNSAVNGLARDLR